MKARHRMGGFVDREDGTAMIEVALILPLMTLLLFGVLDFSVLMNQYLRVVDSARVGAEAATVRVYATNGATISAAATNSTNGIPGYAVTSSNYCTCANGVGVVSCNSHTACGSYGIPNQYVKVTATATLPLLFAFKGFPATYSVQSVAIARTAWTGTN